VAVFLERVTSLSLATECVIGEDTGETDWIIDNCFNLNGTTIGRASHRAGVVGRDYQEIFGIVASELLDIS
jgi:hypothetical protein